MLSSGVKAVAAVIALVLCASGAPARAQTETAPSAPPPLDAYSAAPAIEFIELSPDGDLVARISVVDEIRAIAVTR